MIKYELRHNGSGMYSNHWPFPPHIRCLFSLVLKYPSRQFSSTNFNSSTWSPGYNDLVSFTYEYTLPSLNGITHVGLETKTTSLFWQNIYVDSRHIYRKFKFQIFIERIICTVVAAVEDRPPPPPVTCTFQWLLLLRSTSTFIRSKWKSRL